MGALPGGPFGPLPYHHHPDHTEALVNAQLSSTHAKASSSQGPLQIIAPKPPNLDLRGVSQFPYLGAYPGIHRANSTTSLGLNGLGIQNHQYAMVEMSPESYYAQPSLGGMNTSPTQMHQSDCFDFPIPEQSPSQQPNECFTIPERRYTAYERTEWPTSSPIMPCTPPISQPHSARPGASEDAESWGLDEDTVPLESDEEEIILGDLTDWDANNIGSMVSSHPHAPHDLYGTVIRSLHALAEGNVLVNYTPAPTDSPLNDPKTAAIFWYFVNVTAPALNLFERNRLDPSRIFSNEPVPKSHQHLWTCRFSLHPPITLLPT